MAGPEDDYRAAHPGVVRMYEIRTDQFRDVTPADWKILLERGADHGIIPATDERTQQVWDDLYGQISDLHRRKARGP